MATFVLIHGGGGTAWGWSFVAKKLEERSHEAVVMDLPCDDPDAGWPEYVESVVEAVGEREGLIFVAHSAGGFVAPLACEKVGAELMVFVAGMVPAPGETFGEWWENTGFGEYAGDLSDDMAVFYNGVPEELAREDMKRSKGRELFPSEPWPLEKWPDIPTRYILFRDDRLFPPEFDKKIVQERLGVVPEEMDGGHCAILARPDEVAAKLDEMWKGTKGNTT